MFSKIRKELLIPWNDAGIYTIIVGGYVRDVYNGKPYRDVDLIIDEKNLQLLADHIGNIPSYLSSNDYSIKSIHKTLKFNYENYAIELLVTKEQVTFDLLNKTIRNGLCLCGIDYKEEWYSDIFLKDVEDQQMTLLSFDNIERSINHWKKLQEKYPWPLRLQQ